MRGAWKPVAGPTMLFTVMFVGLVSTEGEPLAVWILLPAVIAGLMFGLAYGGPAYLVVWRFLRGMETAGAAPRIVEDEMGWLGKRTTTVASSCGRWHLEGEGGRRWFNLYVDPPGGERELVQRDKVEAGEEMATRVMMDEPAWDPAEDTWGLDPEQVHRFWERVGPHRWTLGILALVLGTGLHLASARGLTAGATTLPRVVLAGGLWVGLVVTGITGMFLGMLALSKALGGKRVVSDTGPPQPAVNGGMITGVGAWGLGVTGPWALSGWLYAQPHAGLLIPVALSVVALAMGMLAARRAGATLPVAGHGGRPDRHRGRLLAAARRAVRCHHRHLRRVRDPDRLDQPDGPGGSGCPRAAGDGVLR